MPMSAIDFNWSHIQKSSPLVPLVNFFGALFVEDLNLVLPNPPLPPIATTNSSPSSLKSKIKVLLSSSNTCVPTGTLRYKFSPPLPVWFFPFPSPPFFALKCCWYLKSISVFKFLSDFKITEPPLPPSPPSGPPNSINFYLLKLGDPDPPSPALIYILTWSKNFIIQLLLIF